jgi:hypothetical protein
MFCIEAVVGVEVYLVTVVSVHIVYCDSGTYIWFVLRQCYVNIFSIVDIDTCICFVL